MEFKNKIIYIKNKKTSMRLAKAEWDAIELICEYENIRKNILFDLINENKSEEMCLTSAIRLFTIVYIYQLSSKKMVNYKLQKIKQTSPIFEASRAIV